nr:hypothetical protein [Tanacetum cinerariifolium]
KHLHLSDSITPLSPITLATYKLRLSITPAPRLGRLPTSNCVGFIKTSESMFAGYNC